MRVGAMRSSVAIARDPETDDPARMTTTVSSTILIDELPRARGTGRANRAPIVRETRLDARWDRFRATASIARAR
jgi:hypothetical protein